MKTSAAALLFAGLLVSSVLATSNHDYGTDEYVTISTGTSPNGAYAITAHGENELGYSNFHLYLTDAATGKKIGPLEEITNVLDTGADAYAAIWSKDGSQVTIVFRISRHAPMRACTYQIADHRAKPLKGGNREATDAEGDYWAKHQESGRIFGTPKKQPSGH